MVRSKGPSTSFSQLDRFFFSRHRDFLEFLWPPFSIREAPPLDIFDIAQTVPLTGFLFSNEIKVERFFFMPIVDLARIARVCYTGTGNFLGVPNYVS